MDDYLVFGSAKSRAMRVLWVMEELELTYSVVTASPRSEEVRSVNPTGKIPVLLTQGVAIPDSVAIMTYLADRHGKLTADAGTVERALQDAFVNAVNDELDAVLWAAARHSFVLPEEHRVPDVKPSLRWEFSRNQDAIADRMAPDGPFVKGAEMTIADILLSHCIGWAQNAKFEVTNERLLTHNAMMRDRPAFKRALKAGV
ncbi:glutathione S-transferase family protein [Gymnodinialimonas ceratoperidinii]|uniref:Glutathione S-transferase family protein n=1 Tax=Gymnodinialimonas ceratoperidinii TaxID=2856823 RepID=A0A8F6YAC5_9RHOB|nr:glutathione S-transferase family protein [Gymnodinialimonas ceratoperidinii]QXT39819.1 glutathione S-transferase family protein [Gymnodinialimonas ceratoperidinii]